ncbi:MULTISPECIES: trypsin-like peptidase domain-containing protein [Gammaproteobacteria]|uniref:trypsin-like peptidase domain-containing protein n=1 Tax=Gammaproteobacteria TaxID=1236 RepID=UPI000DD057E8|nr:MULTISPECIES: trypsin-like peptidase domain-containing protein [Gammaproteobacteria]RTE86340.1 PDZ domain-containing protein [Aliidiomarina sp. B3213]TCZ91690.1 PDZ domain-containing protein [Lysobacter sp. N42]
MPLNRKSPLTQYIIKPALLGFIVAALVLLILPILQNSDSEPQRVAPSALMSYAEAVEVAAPAVVNIYTERAYADRRAPGRTTSSVRLGSGVIMDARGYILTALHVVASVDHIHVALQDGRFLSADLVGIDQFTDLAVLRIDADNLPVIPRNSEYRPRVGDVVLAIGNPFNIGQAVTQGIISAAGSVNIPVAGRSPEQSGYAEFIQMDAAISDGNSGGALVNSRGELVGINSARFMAEQGATGIHFSVEARQAEEIMNQIIGEGVVTRGYLGIDAGQDITGLNQSGITVDGVTPNSPAEIGGLRQGDVITHIDEVMIHSVNQALDIVAQTRPGTTLQIDFIRNEEEMQTEVTIQRLDTRG